MLCLLAAGWALPDVGFGQGGPAPGGAASPDPQALLVEAERALEGCTSVSAKIVHEAHLFDKHLVGSGIYLQQRSGRVSLTRLELRLQIGDQTSSLVQVCDGRALWTKRNVLGTEQLSRIDVEAASAALQPARDSTAIVPGDVLPGLGGLSDLLKRLGAAFEFTAAQPGRWGNQPAWRLTGRWKPDRLVRLLPEQKAAIEAGQPADLSQLPAHLPDQVVVLLLAQEPPLFYRLEYRRVRKGGPASVDSGGEAIVTMELRDLDFVTPIDPNRFIYNPGDLPCEDRTAEYIRSLGGEK